MLEEFNARVMKARYTPVDGPPLITMPRDVDAEVGGGARGCRSVGRPPAGSPPSSEPRPRRPSPRASAGVVRKGS